MENVKNFERIRRVTQYYDQLQGLRQVPFGILFLLMAVWKAGWWPWFGQWQPLSGLFFIGLALIAFGWVGRYYRRTFGQVRQLEQNNRLNTVLGILFMLVLWLGGLAEYEWQWPVSATGLLLAGFLAVYYFQTGHFRTHFLWLAALLAAVSLLPLVGLLQAEQVYLWGPDSAVGVAVFGLIILVGGLVDHWLLRRTLLEEAE